ncbi:MAG: hypothetical protein IPL24_05415 [Bacteroidetes bacterium]|nr:hypothetical protein [Bacteroidota bacterium]
MVQQPIHLTAPITGGGSPYTYSWSDGTSVVGTTSPLSVIAPVGTTTYTVTVTDACLNTATATVAVVANVVPVVTVSGNAPVCGSGSLTLTASGATSYAWSPATGLNFTIQQQ